MNFTPEEKERVAEENYKLIFAKVKQFRNTPIPEEDLISAAHLGFTKALNNFDKSAGFKFSTFAYRSMHFELVNLLRYEKYRADLRSIESLDAKLKYAPSYAGENEKNLYAFVGKEEDKYGMFELENVVDSAIKKLNEKEKIVFESMLNGDKSTLYKRLGVTRQMVSRYALSVREKFRKELERKR